MLVKQTLEDNKAEDSPRKYSDKSMIPTPPDLIYHQKMAVPITGVTPRVEIECLLASVLNAGISKRSTSFSPLCAYPSWPDRPSLNARANSNVLHKESPDILEVPGLARYVNEAPETQAPRLLGRHNFEGFESTPQRNDTAACDKQALHHHQTPYWGQMAIRVLDATWWYRNISPVVSMVSRFSSMLSTPLIERFFDILNAESYAEFGRSSCYQLYRNSVLKAVVKECQSTL
ncbi:hypothetical protein Dda_7092 [Drechslerella dactyloides]|uniref:Uncharacterized protein n=1 Tax=Drechslerella dactyloides TaxID=74499 RepID=A0AAD6NH80_DREDA|nr:hypothetical protein Dda_7092 [Drechslerella dactyloides]